MISSPVISRRYSFTSSEPTLCALAVLVDVLEQVLARQVAAALDDRGEPAVLQLDVVLDAVLGAEIEHHVRCRSP